MARFRIGVWKTIPATNIHADRAVESPVAEAEGPWHAAIVYVIHVMTSIWVNFGSDSGLLPGGT